MGTGSRCASGDAYKRDSFEPCALNFGGVLDMVRARAASHADFGEPTRISRVLAAYDDHDIGARCELGGAILALLRS